MSYTKGKLPCGCYTDTTFNPGNYTIMFCPKHAAAPAMYEATKIALGLVKNVLYEHPDDAITKEQEKIIKQALAKANGG